MKGNLNRYLTAWYLLVGSCAALSQVTQESATEMTFPRRAAPESPEEAKYFVFHKPGVSVAEAKVDFAECMGFSSALRPMFKVPDSIDGHKLSNQQPDPQYGIVGGVIVGLVADHLSAKMSRGNLRNCMRYRGYKRYPESKDAWTALYDGSPADTIDRLAKIAAGPTPTFAPVLP